MRRSFGIDVLSCPQCKGRLRLVAVVFDRAEVRRLLAHLRCFSDPLPIHPARVHVALACGRGSAPPRRSEQRSRS